jgi:predicted metal-dependent hydrolase
MITPRDFDVDLEAVPRAWFAGDQVATAISNGINLLFPHGERFFVRSVKHFLPQIEDPRLRADIKAFFGQEGRHAHAHDDYNAVLRAQGYEIDEFLGTFKKVTDWIEARVSPEVRLAATAAAEHFTASLAEGAFNRGGLYQAAPAMQQLLAWHAAEEIEHKSVAYDVLQAVDPSYALRVIGLAYATAVLAGFWIAAARMLLKQDGYTIRGAWKHLRTLPKRDSIGKRVFAAGIKTYLRRDFHPSQIDNDQDAARWFAAHGLQMPEAA